MKFAHISVSISRRLTFSNKSWRWCGQ
jgi:hypothetical protein